MAFNAVPAALAVLAVLAALATTATANTTFPQTAEIDLVFPHNTTYVPAELFPIVVVVQNPPLSTLVSNRFQVSLNGTTPDPYNDDMRGIEYPFADASQAGPLYLYTYATNITAGTYMLYIEVVSINCSVGHNSRTNGTIVANYDNRGFGVVFTVADSGSAVDLVAATASDACNSSVSLTWNVTATPFAQYETVSYNITTCAILSEETPWPAGNPCAATVDTAAAASISAKIRSWSCTPYYCPINQTSVAMSVREGFWTKTANAAIWACTLLSVLGLFTL